MKRILRRMTAFAVLLILLLLCGCDGQQTPVESTQEPMGDRVITVNAVGDIYLTDEMLSDAIKPDGTYDFMSQFSDVYACLSKADLTIGNFEGNFSGEPYGPATGSYPNELAAALNDAGFDLLQTANSYSVYNGLAGLQRTKMVIENNGMQTMGTYSSQQDRQDNQVACLELDGIRVAVIAMTKGLGGMSLPADDRYCVDLLYSDYDSDYEQIDEAGILSVIQAAEALNPDIIIACLHWGSENVSQVSSSQEKIADLMFHNGVDVILGAHSHLVGEVESRTVRLEDGTRKNVLIAYSLGDFCRVSRGETNLSPILNMEFTKDGSTGQTSLTAYSVTSVVSMDRGAGEIDRYAVMDADSLITLYEANYYDRISKDLYDSLLSKRVRLLANMGLE